MYVQSVLRTERNLLYGDLYKSRITLRGGSLEESRMIEFDADSSVGRK